MDLLENVESVVDQMALGKPTDVFKKMRVFSIVIYIECNLVLGEA
jgi:hypothetical protein